MCKQAVCAAKIHNSGSTSSLHKHLKTHGTSVVKRQSQHGLADTRQPSKRIYDLLPKLDSTQVVISRLVALDGIPMATLVTSKDMRRFFSKDGLTVYKSATSIRSGIMKYYDEVVARYSKEMIDGLENGSKYSRRVDIKSEPPVYECKCPWPGRKSLGPGIDQSLWFSQCGKVPVHS